ncbi:MAG: HDOD domain-containing protein [Dehalococcoidia bacterium]|jgi:hypothetical protein|nr:HDOD domain-containing protein [Dehalococcoidia bacterium]
MDQNPVSQHGPAEEPTSFGALCQLIDDAQGTPAPAFVALLELDQASPFAKQQLAMHMSRDASFNQSIEASYLAAADRRPSERPLSARDIIGRWGYRVTHCSSVLSGLVGFLGEPAMHEPHRDFWLRAAVIAAYTAVLADGLKIHEDQAFSGSLLRSTALFLLDQHQPAPADPTPGPATSSSLPLWDLETERLGGSHLDLAGQLGERWGLSPALLAAFTPTGDPNSLPDLITRATAAAERHGFRDPHRPIVPPHLRPDSEPFVDAYFRSGGNTPEAFLDWISGMLALTPLVDLKDVA